MKTFGWLVILIVPALVGCNGLTRQLPTPIPSTLVPTVRVATATATLSPTATLAPTPEPSVTPTLVVRKPSDGTSGSNIPAQRIQFQTGAIASTLQANLAANKVDYYTLRALGGQKMTVVATPVSGKGDLLLQIVGADGNPLKTMGAGGPNWTGVLPSTQDYYIAISTPDGSAATYKLDITIPPLGK